MGYIKLFRKRYIPDELIELKDDVILHMDENLIVTSWHSLKPRVDIAGGYSAYFLNEGWKISRILRHDGTLVYWYCDIIDTVRDKENNSYIFHDLLIDILVYPDDHVEVVDLNEFADILEQGTLTASTVSKALRSADALLQKIYLGGFGELTQHITNYIEN